MRSAPQDSHTDGISATTVPHARHVQIAHASAQPLNARAEALARLRPSIAPNVGGSQLPVECPSLGTAVTEAQ
jgi:hypothetical protein